MVTINSLLVHQDTLSALLLDMDESVRAAILCWAFVLSAFVVLRIPRPVLLGCLVAATATVGLAVTVIELTPERAIASAVKPAPAASNADARPDGGIASTGMTATPELPRPARDRWRLPSP